MTRYSSSPCPFCGHVEVTIDSNLNWWNVQCLGVTPVLKKCRASLSDTHEFKTGYGSNHVSFIDANATERRWPRWDSEKCENEGLKRWNKRSY